MVGTVNLVLSRAISLVAAGVVASAVAFAGAYRRRRKRSIGTVRTQLRSLAKDEVPPRLRSDFYFDFESHHFEHAALLTSAHDVVDVLGTIHTYTVEWLLANNKARKDHPELNSSAEVGSARIIGKIPPIYLESGQTAAGNAGNIFLPSILIGHSSDITEAVGLHVCCGAQILGGTFDLRSGGIWLGEGATIDPGVHITGPAIIGRRVVLRPGAYIRGDVIIGDDAVLRGELKNTVIMNEAELAHPGYAGDTIVGWKGHFGCQALTANLGLFGAELCLPLQADDVELRYSLGRRKVGVILGDGSQLGCNTVTDPGTFIGPRTHIYPLTRLAAGVYGPDEIVKNQPDKVGAIVRVRTESRCVK